MKYACMAQIDYGRPTKATASGWASAVFYCALDDGHDGPHVARVTWEGGADEDHESVAVR